MSDRFLGSVMLDFSIGASPVVAATPFDHTLIAWALFKVKIEPGGDGLTITPTKSLGGGATTGGAWADGHYSCVADATVWLEYEFKAIGESWVLARDGVGTATGNVILEYYAGDYTRLLAG